MSAVHHEDRIVLVPVADLVPYARNARTHSAAQIDQIVASIKEFRWTNPVLIDEANGIVAGHGRALAAAKIYEAGGSIETVSGGALPAGMVPAIVARGWTDAQKRAYVLADNKLALNAGWDDSLLRIELDQLQNDGFDLAPIGFLDIELQDIFADKTTGLTDPDDAPEPPKDPVSRLGDVWLLGATVKCPKCGKATPAGKANGK